MGEGSGSVTLTVQAGVLASAFMGRRLGQHFLRPASAERLLAVIDPQPDQSFLEIGPGAGALTLPLPRAREHVIAVELDARARRRLRKRAPPTSTVVRGDALDADLAALAPPGTRLVGNLPYYISSPLLRRFLDLRDRVPDVHVMLQDEVARRIAVAARLEGVRDPLRALRAHGPTSTSRCASRPAPSSLRRRSTPRSCASASAAPPRAPLVDPAGLRAPGQTAFTRRRRTLENNLRDSYPNLKEHLRLLNIEGRGGPRRYPWWSSHGSPEPSRESPPRLRGVL